MSNDTSKLLNACVEYRAMVDRLEAENAKLRKDKERLDFWNANHLIRIGHSSKMAASGCGMPGWYWELGSLHQHYGIKNIRDTLDSAIAWHKKPKGPKKGIHDV